MTNTLNIKGSFYYAIGSDENLYAVINYVAVEYNGAPTCGGITVQIDPTQPENPSADTPLFHNPENAVNYYGADQAAVLLGIVNATAPSTYYTDYVLEFVDPEVMAALVALQNQFVSQTTTVNG